MMLEETDDMAKTKAKGKASAKSDELDAQIGIRVRSADKERIEALASRFPLLASPVSIARAALLLGLEQIEKDPTLLIREEPKPKR